MITAKVNQQLQKNYPVDPVYIQTEEGLSPTLVNTVGTPKQTKIVIQTQYNPLSLYRDRGVFRVFAIPVQPTIPLPSAQFETDSGSFVDMVSVSDLDDLRSLRFSKPALHNLKFRREGRNIYILGLNQDTYQMLKFNVTYFPRISILEDLNDGDIVPMTEDIYGGLIDATTKIVYQQIYGSGADIRADATQNPEPTQINSSKTNSI